MRAKEFVSETKSSKLTKRQHQATKGVNIVNDRGANWASDYGGYRAMMAAASTDGKAMPDMSKESYVGKKKTAYPYTKEEQDILKIAYKIAGQSYTDPNHGDMRSLELNDTNKVSPVPKRKKNKYGV
jgi:hypothetical protein